MSDTPNHGHWAIGLGLALLANLGAAALIALATIAEPEAQLALLVPGLTQLVVVLPATFFLLRSGKKRTVWGLLIGAGLVILLNGACFGLVIGGLSGMH